MYFACAELDDFVPPSMVDELEQHLATLPIAARVERYPGVGHGFAFPSRGEVFDEPATKLHYARILDLFGRTLRRI